MMWRGAMNRPCGATVIPPHRVANRPARSRVPRSPPTRLSERSQEPSCEKAAKDPKDFIFVQNHCCAAGVFLDLAKARATTTRSDFACLELEAKLATLTL